MPNLSIIDPGFYSSVQDMGRFGHRSLGVPISGPMDHWSFKLAQQLVGNLGNEALLECTLNGPKILFSGKACLAITGAPTSILLNDKEIPMNQIFQCDLGDLLQLGNCEEGMRNYIAFKGGLQTPSFMGSRSYYYPITPQFKVNKGDKISFLETSLEQVETLNKNPLKATDSNSILEVSPGPEWKILSKQVQRLILKETFNVGTNDRMGYHLLGKLPKNDFQLPSSCVVPGVFQLTPNGTLLVTMADAQTTGGYPRVLVLNSKSLAVLAQKRVGEKIQLKFIL